MMEYPPFALLKKIYVLCKHEKYLFIFLRAKNKIETFQNVEEMHTFTYKLNSINIRLIFGFDVIEIKKLSF